MDSKQHAGNPDRMNINGNNELPRRIKTAGNSKAELKTTAGKDNTPNRYLKGE